MSIRKTFAPFAFFGLMLLAAMQSAQAVEQLAPGFSKIPKGSTVLIMPSDIELYSLSAGGVPEPKADWTEAASRYFAKALIEKKNKFGLNTVTLNAQDADSTAEVNALHGAVAQAINLHHFSSSSLYLPTKAGALDWSLGDSVLVLREKTQADYAIFTWVRDSYASAERKAAMIAMAIFGVGLTGGMQVGYASLVDLRTGRILWFNKLISGSGDMRELDKARNTVDNLLDKFPVKP
ncbi:hypothetical protein [Undibacterium sp. Tian12W]|uniref:hypothetical protein n=1 Tax=Undibacterium sp. Tian12W TaxID=3413054 RepID=UPI003BF1557A